MDIGCRLRRTMNDWMKKMNIHQYLLTQVDRIKFETVKTVNNPGFYSINTGINPGVNKKIFIN